MLLSLLVGLCIIALVYWALTTLPLPPLLRQIGVGILVIVAVLWAIGLLTGRHFLPGV
jgi:hypothetical protein